MSETLCTLRGAGGGGGRYKETSLWTNPSPSSDFALQTVTLSEGLSNYKYVKIIWAWTTTQQTSQYQGIHIVPVDTFVKYIQAQNNVVSQIGAADTNDYSYVRNVFYVSDTSIRFGNGYRISSTTRTNTYCIPLEILGLNELAHGTVQTATGTCERGASPVTVNLGFRPSFVLLYKTNASSSSTSAGDSLFVADTGFSTSYVLSAYKESSGSTFTKVAMNSYITITDTGFTFTSSSSATFRGTYRYVAIGSTTE